MVERDEWIMIVIQTAIISSTGNGEVIGSNPMRWLLGWSQQNKLDKQKFCKNLSEWVQIPKPSCLIYSVVSKWLKEMTKKMNHDRDFYSKLFFKNLCLFLFDIEGSNPSHASM